MKPAKVIPVAIVALLVFLMVGLIPEAIRTTHKAAERAQCVSNLKHIAVAIHGYHDTLKAFPPATIAHPTLPPEKRISWIVLIRPYVESTPQVGIDESQPWDAKANCPPRWRGARMDDFSLDKQLVGEIAYLLCSANPARNHEMLPCPTHYVGIAGIGENAAELPMNDRSAGIFGHYRRVTLKDIVDGPGATMMLSEVLDGGPWTAGGPATVRGLVQGERPYLGEKGQLRDLHGGLNVAFVDCSIRSISPSLSPRAFEAFATFAGGDDPDEIPQ